MKKYNIFFLIIIVPFSVIYGQSLPYEITLCTGYTTGLKIAGISFSQAPYDESSITFPGGVIYGISVDAPISKTMQLELECLGRNTKTTIDTVYRFSPISSVNGIGNYNSNVIYLYAGFCKNFVINHLEIPFFGYGIGGQFLNSPESLRFFMPYLELQLGAKSFTTKIIGFRFQGEMLLSPFGGNLANGTLPAAAFVQFGVTVGIVFEIHRQSLPNN